MASEINAFQDAFHFAGLSLSLRTRRNNFTAGANDWIQSQAPPSAPNVLVLMLEASIALSATGSSTAVTGSDVIDEWFSQLEIAPSAATAARIFLKTRKGAEEYERLALDTSQSKAGDSTSTPYLNAPGSHIGSYQRATPATFTASGTRTDTSELWVAVGGPAFATRLTVSAITAAYASAVTVTTYTIGFFEIYSVYTGTFAAFENVTATLATGNNQDVMALNVYPAGIATDLVSIVTQTTTNITAMYLTDSSGGYIVNMDDTQSINAQPYVYPRFACATPSYSAIVLYLHKTVPTQFRVSLANSVSLDFLWIACTGPQLATLDPKTSPPAPDETQRTGTPYPGATGGQPAPGSSSASSGGTPAGVGVGKPAGPPGRTSPKWG